MKMTEQDAYRLALIADRIAEYRTSYNYEFVKTADWSDVEFLFDLLKRGEDNCQIAATLEHYIGALQCQTIAASEADKAASEALLRKAQTCLLEWVEQDGWTDASVQYQVSLSREIVDAINERLGRPVVANVMEIAGAIADGKHAVDAYIARVCEKSYVE